MIHYHGTPISPRPVLESLAGLHFCVSYADARDAATCHRIGQSVMLDNGAFTVWRQGRAVDWDAWAAWADEWLAYPTTWAVLPDSIDGGELENDRLLDRYAARLPAGQVAPVWHLHEPIRRLRRLCRDYRRVCFGSSGAYRDVGSVAWRARVSEAFDAIADGRGRVPWIHMLRGMKLAGDVFPFASVDSANVARNHAPIPSRGKARQDPRQMADRHDAVQCPALWLPNDQLTLKEEIA